MNILRYFLTLLMVILTVTALAEELPDDIEPGDVVNDIQLPLTKKSAAELAHIESGGKVMSVDENQEGNHVYFSVKVLHDNGKIKIYHIDRDSGHAFH